MSHPPFCLFPHPPFCGRIMWSHLLSFKWNEQLPEVSGLTNKSSSHLYSALSFKTSIWSVYKDLFRNLRIHSHKGLYACVQVWGEKYEGPSNPNKMLNIQDFCDVNCIYIIFITWKVSY
ncbi:hypothetical protein ANANG_G00059040 [Anguilla anguilla]|uniref:Uncharacterized protein n=1 Tax=Anguilla anguilla TaxID=7936 RepID=A0A9D3S4W3_ANGAN|nr:hypothetical protein ANANG_G00059040 [Anguilla anguilla]